MKTKKPKDAPTFIIERISQMFSLRRTKPGGDLTVGSFIHLIGHYEGEDKVRQVQIAPDQGLSMQKGTGGNVLDITLPFETYAMFAALPFKKFPACNFDNSKDALSFQMAYDAGNSVSIDPPGRSGRREKR